MRDDSSARRCSRNYATGEMECGVSVYELDSRGFPQDPDPGGETESGDTYADMQRRIRDWRQGLLPAYIVTGVEAGVGWDGEPVLSDVVVLGEWDPQEPDFISREGRKMGSLSGIQEESPTPLDYRGKFWGRSTRYSIIDPEAPEPGRGDTYFTSSHPGFVPPTDPKTVAWMDVFEDGGSTGRPYVYIAFMAVREDHQRQGLARRLVDHLYATHPEARIEWGDLVHRGTERLYADFKARLPDQTGNGRAW
jgi:GNAT superfamily N-acetyltransferase